jgi:phospholipid/cholesterol/gamma-HCH transport system substrate-binding protein
VKINKETQIGIFTLVAGIVLYWGFNFLKGTDFISANRVYYVFYNDIDGLTVSNPVLVNGMNVGKVKKLEIINDGNSQIKVHIEIQKGVQLTDSCVALLADGDLLGGKMIRLKLKNKGKVLEPKSVIPSDIEIGLTDKLADKATPIMNSIDEVLKKINATLDNDTQTGLKNTIKNFEATSADMKDMVGDNKAKFSKIATNLEQLSGKLKETSTSVNELIAKFDDVADSLKKVEIVRAVDNANKAVTEVQKMMENINSGKGTLGMLAKNDSLYRNLNNVSADLDKLLIDMRERPKRYVHFSVFGRKDK